MKINYNYGNNTRKMVVVLIAIIYVVISVSLSVLSRNGNSAMVYQGFSVQGVLSAIQLLLALSMVAIEYSIGGILALVCVIMAIFSALFSTYMTSSFVALPGIMTNIASIIAILIIRKRLKIEHSNSLTDELTGIGNRRYIVQYVEHLTRAKKSFYLMFFEIDNIKLINDIYGFVKVDNIIKKLVAEWDQINSSDIMLGRFSGAEFVAVIKKDKCDDLNAITEKFFDVTRSVADESISLRDTLSISMGVVECPTNDNRATNLLSKADLAVREAHKIGRNFCVAYKDSFEDELLREQYIESRIKRAISDKKFYMVYQPQFTTKGKKIRGFESLIRMDASGQEALYPGDFIPVAEKTDLIINIGEYVLRRVCEDFSPVIKNHQDILVSVNISAKQLLSRNFIELVEKILKETDFNPGNLEIEITEYCVMDTAEEAISIVNQLKSMGIKLAMDDFGTGYSSLSYLSRLPLDLLKIDKSLIDDIRDGEIVQAICSMAHALSCEVIAEGVEEEGQIEVLKERGCDFIQGYIWSKPISYEAAIKLL